MKILKYYSRLFSIMVALQLLCCKGFTQVPAFAYKAIPAKYYNTSLPLQLAKKLAVYNRTAFDATRMLPVGYVKDGSADYTAYIQSALDKHQVVRMPDFPIMVNDSGLTLRDGQVLVFNTRSAVVLKSTALGMYEILRIHSVKNVMVVNAVIYGDKNKHLGTTGQWGMGIAIRAAKNVTVSNPKISRCWGDGIYVGHIAHQPAEDVTIYNAMLDDNRRNGLSVTAVNGLLVQGGVVANSNGQMPQSGIDIEPNFAEDVVNNITINNVVTYNHPKYGIVVSLQKLAGRQQGQTNISINRHTDEYSGIGMGIIGKPGLGNITGNIKVSNPTWLNNREMALRYPVRHYGMRVLIDKPAVNDIQKLLQALKKQPEVQLNQ